MSTSGNSSNFFLLLGLDPKAPWNDAEFQRVLQEKKREWSKKSNGFGAAATEAKGNLQRYSEIERVMMNADERAAQAKAALLEADKKKTERLHTFEEALKIAEIKGYVLETEVAGWVSEYKEIISEAEIRRRIKVNVTAKARRERPPQLEPAKARAIREDLDLLQEESLYTLLSNVNATPNGPKLHDRSPLANLQQAAKDLNTQMLKQMKKDVVVEAKNRLAGHGMNLFKTEDDRKRYNETLRQEALTKILKPYETAWTKAGLIDDKQAKMFIEAASKKGWDVEEVEDYLQDLALRLKIAFHLPSDMQALKEKQRCGNCGHLNEKESNFCQNCKQALRIKCPKCGRNLTSDEVICSQCGFPAENRYWVQPMIEESARLLAARHLAEAQHMLEETERGWPAPKEDALAQQIQDLKRKVQQQIQEEQQATTQLRQLLDHRQFFAARQALRSLSEGLPDRDTYQRTIEEGIKQAQGFYQRIFQTNLAADQKVDLCLQALRACADYEEARNLLATMPPEPPANLQVIAGERIVSLKWSPSPSANTRYVILRKSGTQPVSVKDGQQVATVPGQVYDDTKPEIGLPLFYAVFADREGVISPRGATAARPVLLTSDATNLTHRVDDGTVDLTWEKPANARNMLIVRNESAPSRSPNDGTRLQLLEPTHLVDRNLQNGRRYFYTLYAEFADQDGRAILSKGVTIEATPERPPEPIRDLTIHMGQTAAGYQVELTWAPPPKGNAVILKTDQPKLHLGDVIPAARLQQYGQVLEARQQPLTDLWRHSGVAYYVPVVVFQNMAYIGQPHRWVSVEDVSNLKAQNLGQTLRLKWTWPSGCQEALVMTDPTGWPDEKALTTRKARVTRAEYDRLGYYDLKSSSTQDCFLIAAALVVQDGETVAGAGTRLQLRLASKIALRYEIKASGGMFGSKQRTLCLYTSGPAKLPALVVRSKNGGWPLNKTDGEFLVRLEGPIDIPKQEVKLPLESDRSFPPNTFIKLFLEDDSSYEYVKIEHPEMNKLRLS